MARRARIDGGADLRPPSARAGARARRRVLCGVVALGVVFAPSPGFLGRARPRFAAADAIDDARTRFVEAGPSAWPDRVAELAKDPGRLGAVVGPLLRDRDPRRAKAGAFCAAWLCDRPQAGGRVTLEDDILRRAARDPAFVADLRGFVAPEGAGFARLLAVARELLGVTGADASLVASAAWILRYETTASNARELLDVWADDGVDASVRGAAAESLFALLGATFRDVGEARSFFAANQGRPLFEWVRDLSAAKDRPDAPLFLRLLAEVRRNLERLHTPDELRPYLLESEAPWPEVRLLAARRTAQLEGEAEPEAWVPLFVEAVSTESDVETLTTLLESFDRLGVAANAAGSEPSARTVSSARPTFPPLAAAELRARCSPMRRSNSASCANGTPRSAAISRVSSIGKPKVSWSWNASPAPTAPASSRSSRSFVPCSRVRRKPSSSPVTHLRISGR